MIWDSAPRYAGCRILLADDHDILRDGLRALLELAGDMQVVGEARTEREEVAEAERKRPDVVLMDITMPELDGMKTCLRIRQQTTKVRVLFLTMHEAEDYFFRALRAGRLAMSSNGRQQPT